MTELGNWSREVKRHIEALIEALKEEAEPAERNIDSDDEYSGRKPKKPKDLDWIDILQLKLWIEACDKRHGNHCSTGPRYTRPYWLIDIAKACIVRAPHDARYVALSYVWGASGSGQATSANFEQLQEEGSLLQIEIPLSIRHVIQLLPQLGESYLWVDRLCIIQDDEDGKQKHISNMAHIYSNACMTIVVTTGTDASYGLRGICGISPSLRSKFLYKLPLSTTHQLTRVSELTKTKWYSRGWTLQETIFSRRTLYLTDYGAYWECHCGTWYSGSMTTDGLRLMTRCTKTLADIFRHSHFPPWPDLHMYLKIVAAYNERQLTYDSDILPAFAGITTSLSNVFQGGFLYGLPELFLDVALLWMPLGYCRRRGSLNTGTKFPSWSWVGWQMDIDPFSWKCGYDYIKNTSSTSWTYSTFDHILKSGTSYKLISTIKWYVADGLSSPTRPVVHNYKTYQGTDELPVGWSRYSLPFEKEDDVDYVYKSDTKTRFRYPIPMPPDSKHLPWSEPNPLDSPFLYCRTTRAYFYIENPLENPLENKISMSLFDGNGQWVGVIRANLEKAPRHGKVDETIGSEDTPPQLKEDFDGTELQEFICISEGNAVNKWNESRLLEEWDDPRRPRNTTLYEFVHVLWVTRVDGICYRKGVGRIEKSSWIKGNPEPVDITLG